MSSRTVLVGTADDQFARALTDITCVLAFAEQTEARIQRALELLRDVVAYDHCAVLIDATAKRPLFATVPASHPAADRVGARMLQLFETVSEHPSQTAGAESYRLPDAFSVGARSLAVPLVTLDAIVGILHVERDAEEYTVHELRLLAITASQFAVYARGLQFLEQAERARTQAEEENRAKDLFLATLSHELRTPLNIVQGWLQMLRSGPANRVATDRAMTIIERNVAVQVQLVDQLLDAARIATGKFQLEIQSLDLLPVISATVDGARPSAALKSIELDYTVPSAGDWRIEGDPARLQQAFANLLVNAIKFTPTGGRVRVHVREDGSHLEIEFRDTGIGIASEHLPNLFEPLWQAHGALRRPQSGLGLGLSIVRQIVRLHSGEVRVESDGPNRGTAVTVRLPLNASPAAAPEGED